MGEAERDRRTRNRPLSEVRAEGNSVTQDAQGPDLQALPAQLAPEGNPDNKQESTPGGVQEAGSGKQVSTLKYSQAIRVWKESVPSSVLALQEQGGVEKKGGEVHVQFHSNALPDFTFSPEVTYSDVAKMVLWAKRMFRVSLAQQKNQKVSV